MTKTAGFHGTRVSLPPGSVLPTSEGSAYFSADMDGAIWGAELGEGPGQPRVYRVEATGSVEDVESDLPHPSMNLCSRDPVRVLEEVTSWMHYHGTKAELRPGDDIRPGHTANFGPTPRSANFVYFTRTLDASIWGAELATGDGRGRVYVVEPTGPFEDDPNLTNARFRGNPTKSFRSRSPLRVLGEVMDWEGHSAERLAAMREGLARLARDGVGPDD